MKTALAVVALAALLAGCGSAAPTTAPTHSPSVSTGTVHKTMVPAPKPTPTRPEADGSAILACTHFRNVINDAIKGVLTDEELRAKIKQVYDTASVSENAGIPDGAQALLAAATSGNPDAFNAAASTFDSACNAVGT